MNLKDQPRDQVTDCLSWMREVAALESPPAPLIWDEIRLGMSERALFLEQFVVQKIQPVQFHLFEGREKPSDQRGGGSNGSNSYDDDVRQQAVAGQATDRA